LLDPDEVRRLEKTFGAYGEKSWTGLNQRRRVSEIEPMFGDEAKFLRLSYGSPEVVHLQGFCNSGPTRERNHNPRSQVRVLSPASRPMPTTTVLRFAEPPFRSPGGATLETGASGTNGSDCASVSNRVANAR